MANGEKKDVFREIYGDPLKIFDFSKGMNTKTPAGLLQSGYTPYCQNVWYDEENALSKMPGTTMLLTDTNNKFSRGATRNLWNYKTKDGSEILLYQGFDHDYTTMKLWKLEKQLTYPANVAMTDITPSVGLSAYKKLCFANYIDEVWAVDGVNPYQHYDGSKWHQEHRFEEEQFRFITVFDNCLFAARSDEHPDRVIWSHFNTKNFTDNPENDGGYYGAREYYWANFPTDDNDPIMWIMESPWGTLLVFKIRSIFEMQGSPASRNYIIKRFSGTKGCVDGWTCQRRGDVILFAGERRIEMLGQQGVIVSPEDYKLKTESQVTPVSTEIDNIWDYSVNKPLLGSKKSIIYSGSELACTLAFDNGAIEILPGNTIRGDESGSTAIVTSVEITTGEWADDDVVGILYLRNPSGNFVDNEDIDIIDEGGDVARETLALVNGTTTFGSVTSTDLQYLQFNSDEVDSSNADVINFQIDGSDSIYYANRDIPAVEQTARDAWQAMNDQPVSITDDWYAQSFKLDDTGYSDFPIATNVVLFFKETGTLTSSMELKLYLCADNSQDDDTTPKFTTVFGSGKLAGDYISGIECAAFTSGGSGNFVPCPGDAVVGDTSEASSTLYDIFVTSGTWNAGTAAGFIWIKDTTGTWTAGETLTIGGTANCMTLAAAEPQSTATFYKSSSGCWVKFDITYWDIPITLYGDYGGNSNHIATRWITIIPKGFSASNYVSWGYNSAGGYASGRMRNSGYSLVQSGDDYTFKLYTDAFDYTSTMALPAKIITKGYYAGADFDRWDNVTFKFKHNLADNFEGDEDLPLGQLSENEPYNDGKLNSRVEGIEYSLGGNDATPSWGIFKPFRDDDGAWSFDIDGTQRWIRFMIKFSCPGGNYFGQNDSFSLKSVKAAYYTVQREKQLMTSCMFEDRYWLSGGHGEYKILPDYEHNKHDLVCSWTDDTDSVWTEVATDESGADTIDFGTSDFSMVVSTKFLHSDMLSATKYLVSRAVTGTPTAPTYGIGISGADADGASYITAYIGSTTVKSTVVDVNDDTWHNIGVGMDRDGNAMIYLDGSDVTDTDNDDISGEVATDVATAEKLFIGVNYSSSCVGFNGHIDNVQLYSRLLQADELEYITKVRNRIKDTNKLQLYLSFEEGTGTTVYDYSGNNNTGTFAGEDSNVPTWGST